jgi:hypothetical protein
MQVLFVLNCGISKDGKEKLTTASETPGMFRQQLNMPTQSVGLRLKHQMRSTGLLMTQDPHTEHSHYYDLKDTSVAVQGSMYIQKCVHQKYTNVSFNPRSYRRWAAGYRCRMQDNTEMYVSHSNSS